MPTTLQNDNTSCKEWIFYDGECPLCIHLADQFNCLLNNHNVGLTPLQTPWVKSRFNISEDSLSEMYVLTTKGKLLGGADGIIYLSKKLWWGLPFYCIAQLPGMKFILRKIYKMVARNRHCFNGSCKIS